MPVFKRKKGVAKKENDGPPPPFGNLKLPEYPLPPVPSSPFGDEDDDLDDDDQAEPDDIWDRVSQGSTALESRLQLFYAMHEPGKNQSAVDSIVSWTESNGIAMLNKMLKNRYGANLDSFEHDRMLSAKMPRNNFTNTAAAVANINSQAAPSLQEQPVAAKEGIQPSKPPRPSGGSRRPSKNNKDKEGKPRKPHRENGSGAATNTPVEVSVSSRRKGTQGQQSKTFSVQIAKKPLSGAKQNLMQVLQMYYIKHDVKKLEPEIFDTITSWTERHGVRRLNHKLLKKYGEDLKLFRAENIKRDNLLVLLKQFYSRYEPDKPASELDTILKWALANGTTSLNDKLKAKYGEDLNDAIEHLLAKSKKKGGARGSRRGSDMPSDEPTRKSGCKMFEPDESTPGICICGEAQNDHARSALRRAHGLTVRLQQRLDAADTVRRSMARPGATPVVKACESYELDLSEGGFGFCKCGSTLSAHKLGGGGKAKGVRVIREIPMDKL